MSIDKLIVLPDAYFLGIQFRTVEGLRFGQFVCNTYLKPGESWPELFYAAEQEAWELLYPSR